MPTDLTDEQVWERVYQRFPREHQTDMFTPYWDDKGVVMVIDDDAALRAHLALSVLWPEIVAKRSGAVLRQHHGAINALCPSPPGHIKTGPDPATAIARLWGEVCGG